MSVRTCGVPSWQGEGFLTESTVKPGADPTDCYVGQAQQGITCMSSCSSSVPGSNEVHQHSRASRIAAYIRDISPTREIVEGATVVVMFTTVAIVGAALGSAFPVVGSVAGGIIGGVVGSAIGVGWNVMTRNL